MAHHQSAQKRIRQTERREQVNRMRVGAIRTSVKEIEAAITGGDQAKAREAFKQAQPVIMRGVSKGILKLSTASRKLSRLSTRIKALG